MDLPIFLSTPKRLTPLSAWHEHIPFAMFLIELAKPRLIVELGTASGDSYCAFCQTVQELSLNAKCFAVDTWKGDPQTGFYGREVLKDLRSHHDPLYGGFSRLIEGTFDDALSNFADGAIDLLHIDGCHTYEAVKHDFESWLPKLSQRSVVLFHDTNIREKDFGVWGLWDELKRLYPHLEFLHGHGLGVLGVGKDQPNRLRALFGSSDEEITKIRGFFFSLGHGLTLQVQSEVEKEHLRRRVAGAEQAVRDLQTRLNQIQHSHGWRALQHYYRLRDRVLPDRSKRRKAVKFVWQVVKLSLFRISNLRKYFKYLWYRKMYVKHEPLPEGSLMSANEPAKKLRARPKRYRHWIPANEPDREQLAHQREMSLKLAYRPLISIVMPTWNPVVEVFRDTLRSVLDQTYDNWELCIAGGCSNNSELTKNLAHLSEEHTRIRVKILEKNLGISANSTEAWKLSRGEFIALLDHDDILAPSALYEVVMLLNSNPDLDLIYTDKDLLTADGQVRFNPLFKPDWSPEIMLSANYLTHLCVIRKELIEKVGGFKPETDGAQDWDLFWRIVENTDRIAHIPKVLYHWRAVPTSAASNIQAKPYAPERQLRVVQDHLRRCGIQATAFFTSSGYLRLTWPMSGRTLVSILIPNRDRIDLLSRCVESILEKTTYKNYEVLVVENGSQPAAFRYYDEIEKHRNVRILSYPKGFNYSAVNNFGAKYARGDILLFLNNDTEIIDPEWLEEMIRWAERKEIGVVGTKLVKRDGTIQHAGVIIGLTGFAGHIFAGLTEGHWGPFGSTEWYRNYLAVTGACLMVRRNVFQEVGGFREDFCHCGSDVEFCLRTKERGYRVVYTPFAKLLHNEAAKRGGSIPNGDFQVSFQYCEQYLRNGDPYFNPNLSYWHTAPRLCVGKEQAPARRSFPSF